MAVKVNPAISIFYVEQTVTAYYMGTNTPFGLARINIRVPNRTDGKFPGINCGCVIQHNISNSEPLLSILLNHEKQ